MDHNSTGGTELLCTTCWKKWSLGHICQYPQPSSATWNDVGWICPICNSGVSPKLSICPCSTFKLPRPNNNNLN